MKNYWSLVLFAGVAVAVPTSPPLASYDQVVAAAVNAYNQEQNPEYGFRLLEAEPQPDWQTTGQTTQPLKFSIKETLCRFSEKTDVSQCDYKEDGVDRDCSGFYSTEQSPPVLIVQCEDMNQEMERIVRSRWRKWRKKAGRFLKKHGVSIGLAALRWG